MAQLPERPHLTVLSKNEALPNGPGRPAVGIGLVDQQGPADVGDPSKAVRRSKDEGLQAALDCLASFAQKEGLLGPALGQLSRQKGLGSNCPALSCVLPLPVRNALHALASSKALTSASPSVAAAASAPTCAAGPHRPSPVAPCSAASLPESRPPPHGNPAAAFAASLSSAREVCAAPQASRIGSSQAEADQMCRQAPLQMPMACAPLRQLSTSPPSLSMRTTMTGATSHIHSPTATAKSLLFAEETSAEADSAAGPALALKCAASGGHQPTPAATPASDGHEPAESQPASEPAPVPAKVSADPCVASGAAAELERADLQHAPAGVPLGKGNLARVPNGHIIPGLPAGCSRPGGAHPAPKHCNLPTGPVGKAGQANGKRGLLSEQHQAPNKKLRGGDFLDPAPSKALGQPHQAGHVAVASHAAAPQQSSGGLQHGGGNAAAAPHLPVPGARHGQKNPMVPPSSQKTGLKIKLKLPFRLPESGTGSPHPTTPEAAQLRALQAILPPLPATAVARKPDHFQQPVVSKAGPSPQFKPPPQQVPCKTSANARSVHSVPAPPASEGPERSMPGPTSLSEARVHGATHRIPATPVSCADASDDDVEDGEVPADAPELLASKPTPCPSSCAAGTPTTALSSLATATQHAVGHSRPCSAEVLQPHPGRPTHVPRASTLDKHAQHCVEAAKAQLLPAEPLETAIKGGAPSTEVARADSGHVPSPPASNMGKGHPGNPHAALRVVADQLPLAAARPSGPVRPTACKQAPSAADAADGLLRTAAPPAAAPPAVAPRGASQNELQDAAHVPVAAASQPLKASASTACGLPQSVPSGAGQLLAPAACCPIIPSSSTSPGLPHPSAVPVPMLVSAAPLSGPSALQMRQTPEEVADEMMQHQQADAARQLPSDTPDGEINQGEASLQEDDSAEGNPLTHVAPPGPLNMPPLHPAVAVAAAEQDAPAEGQWPLPPVTDSHLLMLEPSYWQAAATSPPFAVQRLATQPGAPAGQQAAAEAVPRPPTTWQLDAPAKEPAPPATALPPSSCQQQRAPQAQPLGSLGAPGTSQAAQPGMPASQPCMAAPHSGLPESLQAQPGHVLDAMMPSSQPIGSFEGLGFLGCVDLQQEPISEERQLVLASVQSALEEHEPIDLESAAQAMGMPFPSRQKRVRPSLLDPARQLID